MNKYGETMQVFGWPKRCIIDVPVNILKKLKKLGIIKLKPTKGGVRWQFNSKDENIVKHMTTSDFGLTKEDILKFGTVAEIAFLKEYRDKNIGIPHPPVGNKKYCEKCGEGMGKMTNKEWEKKGRICDTCGREEHLDKETR